MFSNVFAGSLFWIRNRTRIHFLTRTRLRSKSDLIDRTLSKIRYMLRFDKTTLFPIFIGSVYWHPKLPHLGQEISSKLLSRQDIVRTSLFDNLKFFSKDRRCHLESLCDACSGMLKCVCFFFVLIFKLFYKNLMSVFFVEKIC